MTFDAVTAEMVQALTDEIEALKEGHGGRVVPLTNGRVTGFAAGKQIYLFDLSSELAVPDDTPAQLIVGSHTYSVTVVAVDGFEVTLAVQEDLGPRVPSASLNTAPWYLLQILIARLQDLVGGKVPANKSMAMRLFNLAANEVVRPSAEPDFERPIGGGSSPTPNEEQKQAVLRALSQMITFIWGPPGTGKTTTINYLVPALVDGGERVFITSHTNAAVDAVLKAAMKGLSEEQIRDGAIIRVGELKEKDEDIKEITLEAVLGRREAALTEELSALEKDLKANCQILDKWAATKSRLEEIERLERARNAERQRLETGQHQVKDLENSLDRLSDEKSRLEKRLLDAQGAGPLKRLFAGLNPARIQEQLVAVQIQINGSREDLKAALGRLSTLQEALTASERALEKARSDLSHTGVIPSMKQVEDEISKYRAVVKDIEQKMAALRQVLQELAQTVIKEAKVVGATLTKLAIMQELHLNQFDNVVVDEASMVPQPHLWLAGALALKRVVVLGDFRQLQPICNADKSTVAQQRIARSIYQEAGIVDELQRVNHSDKRLVSLRKQYRMHAAIGELSNELVYRPDGNPLEHLAPTEMTGPGLAAQPHGGSPVILCDTSSANPWCARLTPGYSRYNIYSAVTAVRLAEKAVEGPGGRDLKIGIICPYSAQARLLRILVAEHNLTEIVKVATVHSFQGSERDIIILDLVDGPPFPLGTLLTDAEAKNLLNVAFSRAKGKLVVVGHSAYLENKSRGGALTITQGYLGRHARIIDSREFLKDYADEDIVSGIRRMASPTPSLNPEGMSLFNEATFFSAFLEDLRGAKKQVIIFSPFIQPGRSAMLIPALRGLVDKGVKVVVVTRPARKSESGKDVELRGKDVGAARVLAELSRAGIKVSTRAGLHEKLAFIDDRITWMGSLNILSHSSTTEQMTRFDSPQLTGTFLEFNGVAALFAREEREKKKASRLQAIGERLAERMAPPRCPKCGKEMVLRLGSYGVFFGCPNYPKDKETANIPRAVLASVIEEMDIQCPECATGRMVLRHSPKGVFLGCSKYPNCRTTEPLG